VSESPCLKVPKTLGEKAVLIAKRLNLFDRELKIQRVDGYLYIPLISGPLSVHIEEFKKNLPEYEVSTSSFPEHTERPLKLIDVLEAKLSPYLLASLPRAIDFVGDIAVIEVPPELRDHEKMVGEAILETHKNLRTVLAKSSAIRGLYRLREFKVIAGEDKKRTVHKEHGCTYHVDISKAYFSPRLSYEHDRVTSQVKENETVIDMFSGVGPFSILIAKRHRNVRVYAIDVNPDAVHYLKTNITANSVEKKVVPILGDARQVVEEMLKGVADRVIMNLPEKALEYVDVACEAVKAEGGIMHYYAFTSAPEPLETVKNRLIEAVKQTGRGVEKVLLAKTVRLTAPYTWQVVIDAEIQ